jgi:hypothetical protein
VELKRFRSVREFERAVLGFYKNDPVFKNNKSGLIKLITNPRGKFFANSKTAAIGAVQNGELQCVCMLICHKASDAAFVSFFEAREGAFAAVEFLMENAAAFAKENGRKRLEVSLDGRRNYSVGFSCGPQAPPIFGESYNPDYYGEFFESYARIGFTSYTDNLENIGARLKYASSITKREFTIKEADSKNFKDSIRRFTNLSNEIFQKSRFYYRRDYEEDLELFLKIKPLLKRPCLLFAQKDGRDAGFFLMHPDFNELVAPGKAAGAAAFFRCKVLNRPISAIKIPEIGVLPEYQSKGTILFLFLEGLRLARLHFPSAERAISGWTLDEDLKSSRLVSKILPYVHKKSAAYEKEI